MAYPNYISHFAYIESGRKPLVHFVESAYTIGIFYKAGHNDQSDPVCGMEIETGKAFAKREHEGRTFYHCSPDCGCKFDADPHTYGHPQEHEHDKGHDTHS